MNIFKPDLGQNASVYIQKEKKSENKLMGSSTLQFLIVTITLVVVLVLRQLEIG